MLKLQMDQSTALHLFRGFASLAVVFGHIRNHLFPDYKNVLDPAFWFKIVTFLAGFGGQAVILFFVMSGWLVGGKFLKTARQDDAAYANYAVDRITRLWTVLLPVFVLHTVLHHQFGVSPQASPSEFAAATLLGNLFGLQTIYFSNFGENYPLWSLANETAYYVLFPLLVIVASSRFSLTGRSVALVVAIAYAAILSQKILLYFIVWLIGVIGCMIPFRRTYLVYIAPPLLLFFAGFCRVYRIDDIFYADIMLAALFAVCIWSIAPGRVSSRHVRRIAVLLASFSFTLYVAHIPIIQTLGQMSGLKVGVASPSQWSGLLYFAAGLSAVVSTSFALYLATEMHTQTVREKIKVLAGIK